MNSYIRLLANVFFAFIISFVFADLVYFGFNFVKSSPINASLCMFLGCFVSSLLVCELFSISKESNKTHRRIKKTRLTKIAKKIALEKAIAYAEIANNKKDNEKKVQEMNITNTGNNKKESTNNSLQATKITINTKSTQISQPKIEHVNVDHKLQKTSETEQKSNNELQSTTQNTIENVDIKISHTTISDPKDVINESVSDNINSNKLVIKNLPFNVSQKDVLTLFSEIGFSFTKLVIVRNWKGSKKKKKPDNATATVTIDNKNCGEIASKLNGKTLRNNIISVSE